MAPPADLRDWIALLEREGELVRVSAEVDPYLEVTEIVDRTVKAGGPALLFERPKGSRAPAADQPVRHRAAHVPRARRRAARRRRPRSSSSVLEMQPPQGLAEKVRGLKKLKSIADSRPKTVRSARPPRHRARRRRRRPRPAPDPALLAGRPGAVHHAAGRDHARPADRARATSACTACRSSTRARPRCTGSSTRTGAWTTSPRTAGSRSPSRSASTR